MVNDMFKKLEACYDYKAMVVKWCEDCQEEHTAYDFFRATNDEDAIITFVKDVLRPNATPNEDFFTLFNKATNGVYVVTCSGEMINDEVAMLFKSNGDWETIGLGRG